MVKNVLKSLKMFSRMTVGRWAVSEVLFCDIISEAENRSKKKPLANEVPTLDIQD